MYISLVFCVLIGTLIGLVHRTTTRFSTGAHLAILLFAGITIPLVAGSILRLLNLIPMLFYYYLVLACAVNLALIIFFDKMLYRKRYSYLMIGIFSGFITILIANLKLNETQVSDFYLFMVGFLYSVGLMIAKLTLKR